MTKPILFVSPEAYPGTTFGMKQFRATGLADHSDEISPESVEGREMVILGAWHHDYYEALQRLDLHNIPTGLYWTSSVGQIDFANNGMEISFLYIIRDMVKAGLLDFLLCGTDYNFDLLDRIVPDKVVKLPYCFDWEKTEEVIDDDMPVGEDWIDLYATSETRKNILVQMHGSKIADAHLHVNFSNGFRYRDFADLIGLDCTNMGWMTKDSYYKSIQTMRLGLQATYAETFDYVLAEHFALRRPCLFSPVIGQWVDDPFLRDKLMVRDTDNPFEVADRISEVINMSEDKWKDLCVNCYKFMGREAKRRNKNGKEILEQLIRNV